MIFYRRAVDYLQLEEAPNFLKATMFSIVRESLNTVGHLDWYKAMQESGRSVCQ